MTRASLREYATVQRERYQHATHGEKGRLLDEIVAVTGMHRKAAIRLLRRAARVSPAAPRAGRPRTRLGRRSTIVGVPPSAVPNFPKSLIVVARRGFSDVARRSIVSRG